MAAKEKINLLSVYMKPETALEQAEGESGDPHAVVAMTVAIAATVVAYISVVTAVTIAVMAAMEISVMEASEAVAVAEAAERTFIVRIEPDSQQLIMDTVKQLALRVAALGGTR